MTIEEKTKELADFIYSECEKEDCYCTHYGGEYNYEETKKFCKGLATLLIQNFNLCEK